jgi:predicted nucleic acid-binding protein
VKIALDTNRYTDLVRGDARARQVVETAAEVLLPLPVLAELRAGFAHGSRREANEKLLAQLLAADGVSVLCPDEQTTVFYASIYAGLRKRGTPVPTNDLWIAALVVQHGAVLFDRDSDFSRIPELDRLG